MRGWGVGGGGAQGTVEAPFTCTRDDEHKVHFYRFCLDRDSMVDVPEIMEGYELVGRSEAGFA